MVSKAVEAWTPTLERQIEFNGEESTLYSRQKENRGRIVMRLRDPRKSPRSSPLRFCRFGAIEGSSEGKHFRGNHP